MKSINIVENTLNTLQIPYTSKGQNLFKQDKVNSFEHISWILHQFKIGHLALKLSDNQLDKIAVQAIAHLNTNTGTTFVLLTSINEKDITYIENDKTYKISILNFLPKWTGNVLLLAPDIHSGEPNYENNRKEELQVAWQKKIAWASLVFIAMYSLSLANTWQTKFWEILQCISIFVSSLLLINEFGKPTPLMERLCQLNKQSNCQTVLHSPASKLLRWLSWAEIGFLFFVGNILSACFISSQATMLLYWYCFPLIVVGSIMSIYYQWRVAKVWCVLCLGVIVVLWFAEAIVYSTPDLVFDWHVIIGYLLSIGLWFIVKPFVIAKQVALNTESELNTWLQNSELFNVWLQKQPHTPIVEWDDDITNGQNDSPLTITIVSNPFCKPCANAHKELQEWADYFEVTIVYRFTPNPFNPDDEGNRMIRHLYSIEDKTIQLKALDDWYEIRKYDTWATKYPVVISEKSQDKINNLSSWCNTTNINYTPSIFINGYLLSLPYTYQHLKYHLNFLIEEESIRQI